jgi:hypothetical protein
MDSPVGAVVATRRSQRPKRTPLDAEEFLLDIDAEILAAEDPDKLGDEYEYDPALDDKAGTQAVGRAAMVAPSVGAVGGVDAIGALGALGAIGDAGVGTYKAGQDVHPADSVASVPAKKKRGRPRKYPVAPVDVAQAPVVKRPRGRPRGSGKHQRAALARSLSVSMTTSSEAGAEEHIAPLTGDQQHRTPPPAAIGPLDDRTPVSHAIEPHGTPSNASQGSHGSQEGRRRRRKGSMPSRGV